MSSLRANCLSDVYIPIRITQHLKYFFYFTNSLTFPILGFNSPLGTRKSHTTGVIKSNLKKKKNIDLESQERKYCAWETIPENNMKFMIAVKQISLSFAQWLVNTQGHCGWIRDLDENLIFNAYCSSRLLGSIPPVVRWDRFRFETDFNDQKYLKYFSSLYITNQKWNLQKKSTTKVHDLYGPFLIFILLCSSYCFKPRNSFPRYTNNISDSWLQVL